MRRKIARRLTSMHVCLMLWAYPDNDIRALLHNVQLASCMNKNNLVVLVVVSFIFTQIFKVGLVSGLFCFDTLVIVKVFVGQLRLLS